MVPDRPPDSGHAAVLTPPSLLLVLTPGTSSMHMTCWDA